MASAGFAAKFPQSQFPKSTYDTTNSIPNHFLLKTTRLLCPPFSWKPRQRFVCLLSKCSTSSDVMQLSEEGHDLVGMTTFSDPGLYSKELGVGVRAVHMACLLCQKIQHALVLETNEHVSSKDDNSPVTIAGFTFISCIFSNAFLDLGCCKWSS